MAFQRDGDMKCPANRWKFGPFSGERKHRKLDVLRVRQHEWGGRYTLAYDVDLGCPDCGAVIGREHLNQPDMIRNGIPIPEDKREISDAA